MRRVSSFTLLIFLFFASQPGSDSFVWAASNSSPFSFVVMGDTRSGVRNELSPIFLISIAEINRLSSVFVFNLGDLIEGGKSTPEVLQREWDVFQSALDQFEMPVYLAAGNHDMWDAQSQQIYEARFGETYFSFEHGGAHFTVLCTDLAGEIDRISGKQLAWFQRDLESTRREQPLFVLMHKPLWFTKSWMEEIHPLLIKHGVDVVFASHYHRYGKVTRDGIRHIVTGGGGAYMHPPLTKGSIHHYLFVTVADGETKIAVIKPGSILSEDFLDEDR
ncbi:MAG: metallophosphoesterase [Candidatus Poribacteria bacterium]|nr:metallophosphoesterase [Candidatus Poribacteria bacterium]